LLLVAVVWSFAHLPLGFSDRSNSKRDMGIVSYVWRLYAAESCSLTLYSLIRLGSVHCSVYYFLTVSFSWFKTAICAYQRGKHNSEHCDLDCKTKLSLAASFWGIACFMLLYFCDDKNLHVSIYP